MKIKRFFNCWMAALDGEYIFASACNSDRSPRLDYGGKGTWLVSRFVDSSRPSWERVDLTHCLVFGRTKYGAMREAKSGFRGWHELQADGVYQPSSDRPLAVQLGLLHKKMLNTTTSPIADLEYHEHASSIYLMLGAARDWNDIYTVYKAADHPNLASLRSQLSKALVTKDPADLRYFQAYGRVMNHFSHTYDLRA